MKSKISTGQQVLAKQFSYRQISVISSFAARRHGKLGENNHYGKKQFY